ncbi:hypothetical protein LUZ63_016565 [Rhynchospora breviuscula]|uniref:Uncharacterized protein n=1 Tax=Rhynchospora breviuscula TaxID=2022672 RepID=A0A9Q0C0J1_9POAL|nr:hypothetical protein LUZ63_016565 [Rhynchospora breviuscula]
MTEPPKEPNQTQNPSMKQPGWQSGVHYPNPPDPETATAWRSGVKYPNPPDPVNPDPLTLRDQWLFATRNYSRWYSRAWGAAILAGGVLYFVGRMIRGSDPVHSHPINQKDNPNHDTSDETK